MGTTEFMRANNWQSITNVTVKISTAPRNSRNWRWRNSGASAASHTIRISPRDVLGWNKNSCTAWHACSIK